MSLHYNPSQAPFRARKEKVKRDEVERRVKEDDEEYTEKFGEDSKAMCKFVCRYLDRSNLRGISDIIFVSLSYYSLIYE